MKTIVGLFVAIIALAGFSVYAAPVKKGENT